MFKKLFQDRLEKPVPKQRFLINQSSWIDNWHYLYYFNFFMGSG